MSSPNTIHDLSGEEPIIRETEAVQAVLPRVFLAVKEGRPLEGWQGALTHLMRLDLHGTYLMGPSLQRYLHSVSLMLLIVFCFDLGAWSLLFNVFLGKGSFGLSLWTPLAIGLGVMMATIITTYEIDYFTADHDQDPEQKKNIRNVTIVRLAFIAVMAFITAQPFHLLIFSGPITQRAHEEQAIEAAIRLTQDVAENNEAAQAASTDEVTAAMLTTPEGIAYQDAKTRFDQADADYTAAEVAATAADGALDTARSEVSRTRRRRDDAVAARNRAQASGGSAESERQTASRRQQEYDAAKRTQTQAEADQRAAAKDKDEKQAQRQRAQEGLQAALASLSGARSVVLQEDQQSTDAATQRRRADRLWVAQLLNARNTDEEVVEENPTGRPRSLPFREYDFFEKMVVIEDLCAGAPPRWPETVLTTGQLSTLQLEFGLTPPVEQHGSGLGGCLWLTNVFSRAPTAPEVAPEDAAEASRLSQELRVLRQRHALGVQMTVMWWVVLFVAMLIPMFVLLRKWLAPAEVEGYYSSNYRARMGDPRARAHEINRRQQRQQASGAAGLGGSPLLRED